MVSRLFFAGLETEVTIVYRKQILSFRSCDESDRWKTVSDVLAGHGKDFFRNWLAYRVTASDYASWFARETFDSTTADEILHLAFVTANDAIDVLSLEEPDILLSPIRDYRHLELPLYCASKNMESPLRQKDNH